MKNYSETVGIDVSKATFDAYVCTAQQHQTFDNTPSGYKKYLKWLKEFNPHPRSVLVCFEDTGIYSINIAKFMEDKKLPYAMVAALEIKRSLGIARGKNDEVDSRRIAEYAYLRRDTLELTKLPSDKMMKLKQLISLRTKLLTEKTGHENTLNEQKAVFGKKHSKVLYSAREALIQHLNTHIDIVDKEIYAIITQDKEMKKMFDLVTSVVGIGPVIGAYLIVTTECFTLFTDARKYACYCGVAPFANSSGTSLRGRSKVSHLAHKKMKSLLFLGVNSAVQHDPQLKKYYHRRLDEGKLKFVVINAVKNKLLHRVFSVVARETPYVKLAHAA